MNHALPRLIAGLILGALLLLAMLCRAEETPPQFCVVPGTIERDGKPVPVILKINTHTGETWQLLDLAVDIQGRTSRVTGWALLHADITETLQQLQRASTNTAARATPAK